MTEIEELERQIAKLRIEKLLNIEYVTEQLKRTLEESAKIRGQIQAIRTLIMKSTDKFEVSKFETLIRSYNCELSALASDKSALATLRNMNRNLAKEEERIHCMKVEKEAGL